MYNYLVGLGRERLILCQNPTNKAAEVAEAAVTPVSPATERAQVVGDMPTISAKRTRPIVTVTAYAVDTAIETLASSREE